MIRNVITRLVQRCKGKTDLADMSPWLQEQFQDEFEWQDEFARQQAVHKRGTANLLRPAAPAAADEANLLRPAQGAGHSDESKLLRPGRKEE